MMSAAVIGNSNDMTSGAPDTILGMGARDSDFFAGKPGEMASEVVGIANDDVWDAGDRGCGELVLELRMRVTAMSGGQVLRLIARDPGAPADIPAWCRMTGHTLLREEHPVYYIKREI
jgi:tRNA 2-thiouridine synthesizing protein A